MLSGGAKVQTRKSWNEVKSDMQPTVLQGSTHHNLSQLTRLWYLSRKRPVKAQARLRIRAVSAKHSLFADTNYELTEDEKYLIYGKLTKKSRLSNPLTRKLFSYWSSPWSSNHSAILWICWWSKQEENTQHVREKYNWALSQENLSLGFATR